jgi:putative transcriptional regulator
MNIEMDDAPGFLEGKLLVAMPGMGDPRFERSVIFVCAHNDEGAMGLIVNKPAHDLEFSDLLDQLDIDLGPESKKIEVHIGGPVEHGRGFVLHSSDYELDDSTMKVTDAYRMTATLEILQDLAEGNGPDCSLLVLGYAGWGPGQLESEFRAHGWVSCDADKEIIFALDDDAKWNAAITSIGIDPMMLSGEGGRA